MNWGKPIERGKIEPKEFDTPEISIPEDYFERVDVSEGALRRAQEIARKRTIASKACSYIARGVIVALRGADRLTKGNVVPFGALADYIETKIKPETNMPKEKAVKFLAKFSASSGIMKWVYLAGAVGVFATMFLAPEYIPVIIAFVYGVQAAIEKYEGDAADEELGSD